MQSRKRAGKLRIIGGEWRGRRLPIPDLPGLRPTTDRNRETLFNWLAPEIAGRHCLDLFAGSGALGLEALSRGAASCLFVEQQRAAVNQLKASLEILGAGDRGRVWAGDALEFLDRGQLPADTDLVFIDPPFDSELLNRALGRLVPQLHRDTLVYLEYAVGNDPGPVNGWRERRSKVSGGVVYTLLEAD